MICSHSYEICLYVIVIESSLFLGELAYNRALGPLRHEYSACLAPPSVADRFSLSSHHIFLPHFEINTAVFFVQYLPVLILGGKQR